MRSKGTIVLLCVLFWGIFLSQATPDEMNAAPRRVLFVGNSYTSQIRQSLMRMLEQSPYKQTTFSFITRGGATLQQHLSDKKTLELIKTGRWDYVVLQGQSQIPGLPGKHGKSFQESVDTFAKLTRKPVAEAHVERWEREE